ncbi:MAG: cyclin family protein [Planctomycetaceae bacterium]
MTAPKYFTSGWDEKPRRVTTRRAEPTGPRTAARALLSSLTAMIVAVCVAAGSAIAQEPNLARERYVPADQLDVIFERTPNGVMLPKTEFESLMQKADLARKRHLDIPATITVRSAAYSVRQVDSHAVVELRVDVEQFIDDWQSVSIPAGHLDLEEATIDGEPAFVGRDPQQPATITLLHRESGRFTLTLKLSTPLGTVGSDRVAVFGVLPNAAATLEIASRENQSVEVNNLTLKRPAAVDQAATYQLPIGSLSEVRIRWTSGGRQSEAETLVFARTAASARLSVDTLRWESQTRITVYGTPVNQIIASVPSSLEVTSVESTGLESWKLEDDPQRSGFTRAVLTYRQPFTDDRIVSIAGVAAAESGRATQIPTLQFSNVTAHTGRLNVSHEDQLRLRSEAGTGIRQLSVNELPISAADTSVFDFWLQDFSLSVAVRPRDRELFSQVNSILSFSDTLSSLQVDVTVEPLNEAIFELELSLPAGWQIENLNGGSEQPVLWRPVGNVQDGNPLRIVVEPLIAVTPGQLLNFTLRMRRSIPDPETPQSLPLPVVSAPEATLVAGSYRVSAASDLEVAPVDIQGLVPIATEGDSLLFETQGTTFSGQLSIARRPVRMSARAELRTWADSRQKTTLATITVDVTNGTTRTLQLLVPEDAGAELRFTVASIGQVPGFDQQQVPSEIAITEQSPAEPVDGLRAYNLTFDHRFAGSVTLQTVIENDRAAGDPIAAPLLRVPGAVRQHGLLVFEATPEQQLAAAEGAMSGLTSADPGLVNAPAERTSRRTALVYRYVQPDYSLVVSETRFDTQPVPTAVCETVENVSLLSDTGSIQRAATVHLRCVGIQTLRFSLPESNNTFLWSTVLNGEAIEVRRDGDHYLVAIPTDTGRTEHTLEILFETPGDEFGGFGTTRQDSVSLSIDTEQGTAQPIEILEQTWDVRYPGDSLLLDHDGGFHPLNGMDQPGWLQRFGSAFQLPTGRTLWQKLIPTAIFLLLLFVATVLMVRRRWKSLAVCGAGCVLLFLVLQFGTLSLSERAASSYFTDAAESVSTPAGDRGSVFEQIGVDFDFNVGPELMGGTNELFGQGGGQQFGGQGGGMPFDGRQELFDQVRRMNAPRDDFSGQVAGLVANGQQGGQGGDSRLTADVNFSIKPPHEPIRRSEQRPDAGINGQWRIRRRRWWHRRRRTRRWRTRRWRGRWHGRWHGRIRRWCARSSGNGRTHECSNRSTAV